MIDAAQLADSFALNTRLIHMQTAGLTHADSLLQPHFRANCLNWIVGHLLVGRNRVLRALGAEPVVAEVEIARYETESEPILDKGAGVWTLEDLLAAHDRTQERIAETLRSTTPDGLAKELLVGERKTTIGQRVFGLYFHDTYHTGQAELLRQLAGTNDKIV
jgi:hypothetical protein